MQEKTKDVRYKHLQCWFCEKNESESKHDILLGFERYNYADRVAQVKGETPNKLKKTLTIARCNACYLAQKQYNRISLYALIPAVLMAASLFLLFNRADEYLIFAGLTVSIIGFGIIAIIRHGYLRKHGIKALVEMEIQNEDITTALANGWYRE